jgi:hypothetical protein
MNPKKHIDSLVAVDLGGTEGHSPRLPPSTRETRHPSEQVGVCFDFIDVYFPSVSARFVVVDASDDVLVFPLGP